MVDIVKNENTHHKIKSLPQEKSILSAVMGNNYFDI